MARPTGEAARQRALEKRQVTRLVGNPVLGFLDSEIRLTEAGQPFHLYPHQREILRLAFTLDDQGILPWTTIVYACPKKSGKTAVNALVTLAWAYTMEAPNECYILANDQEQARSRAYGAATKLIRKHPELLRAVDGEDRGLAGGGFDLDNGTIVRALASDAAGAAGSNHGFVSFDELWAYTSQGAQRLWDEMTAVPTRKNSVRFITTYAGFENESKLLWELYETGVGTDEYRRGRGQRLHPTLPVYGNREAGLLVYWDHEPRMEWQTAKYYSREKITMRAAAYLRVHENRWVSSTARFLTGEQWDALVDETLRPRVRAKALRVVVGVDAATKKDSLGLVAVTWDAQAQKVRLVNKAVFRPSPGQPVELEETATATLRRWHTAYDIESVVYDPYQFVAIAQRLEAEGMPMEEYPQTSDRLTAMGQTLWDLIVGRNLVVYADPDLREHALNAVSVETPRGWKLAKDKATKKIDLLIALAMACHRVTRDVEGGVLPLHTFTEAELTDAAMGVETTDAAGEPMAPDAIEAARVQAEHEMEERERREIWTRPEAWR